MATGGAWVFYFADAPTLLVSLFTLQAPAVAYISVAILTATTFVFGGFMREQICIYMCPWPRIQGAMMDEETITVAYRDHRGEPRGKHRKSAQADELGDCIDCNACVNVCPMGIDIRDGQQLACITCALCIDACDDVMERIDKPRGLIDYVTLSETESERAGNPVAPVWKSVFRPRVILYTVLWSAIGIGLVAALILRTDMTIAVEPVRNPINVTLSDGSIRNAYELRLRNMTGAERDYRISVAGSPDVALELQGVDGTLVAVPADTTTRQRVYLTAPADSAAAASPLLQLEITAEDAASGASASESAAFRGRQE